MNIVTNVTYVHFLKNTYLQEIFAGNTDHVHVDAVGVAPCVLEVLLEALAERVRDLVEPNELLHLLHLGVVARRARVEALDDRRHVAEYARVHQRWKSKQENIV